MEWECNVQQHSMGITVPEVCSFTHIPVYNLHNTYYIFTGITADCFAPHEFLPYSTSHTYHQYT